MASVGDLVVGRIQSPFVVYFAQRLGMYVWMRA